MQKQTGRAKLPALYADFSKPPIFWGELRTQPALPLERSMGRLTEVFDIIKNGFDEPENYNYVETRESDTRELLITMRRKAKTIEQPSLWAE